MRDLWAVVSDPHCGSTLGLCPSDGVELDDGGHYLPSAAQRKLWDCWLDFWKTVRARRRKGDRFRVVINGDWVDGDHHRTGQIVSKNLAATQHEIAVRALHPAIRLNPETIVVIRGTEAHVGASAEFEERAAREVKALRCPATSGWSWWHFQALSQGVLLDFAHHGSVGRLPWTRPNAAVSLAARIALAAAKQGGRAPDLAIRSHMHQGADSYDHVKPTRVIQTRGWQLSTSFVHRIAAGSLPEIGGLLIACEGGRYEVEKVEFDWRRDDPWQPK